MVLERIASFCAQLMQPRYQIGGMLLTALALSSIIYKPLTEFNTTDPKPTILPYLPKKQVTSDDNAVTVKVGLRINNFPAFDMINSKFIADLTLWFEFDPSLLPLETVQKFSFDRATIVNKSEPDMKIVDNKLFVQYRLRLEFTSAVNHKLFPLNDHIVYLVLKNDYVSPNELLFYASRNSFIVAPAAHTADWTIIDLSAQNGYFEEQLDTYDTDKIQRYPAVVFSLALQKSGIRKIFIIVLPMLVLFFISLFTLSLNPDPLARSILALSTGTLTGLIAYRFVIEKVVPDVGYFTFTDHVFNLFLAIIFIIFMVNIFSVSRGKNDTFVLALKGLMFLFIQIIIVLSAYLLVR